MNYIITWIFRNLFQRNQLKNFNHLVALGNLTDEEKKSYQLEKLIDLLKEAKSNVPYYKDVLKDIDLEEFSYSDYQKVRLLNKKDIRENSVSLCNVQKSKFKNIIKNSSGGSTGEPVVFYQTQEQKNSGGSNYYYANFLNGVSPYDNSVIFWGALRDMYGPTDKGISVKLKEYLNGTVLLNTFVMSDVIMAEYVEVLRKEKPVFIKAYVHSLFEISKFVNKNKIQFDFTPIIQTTTGPLYDEIKIEIKKAFNNAHVFNFYGSREVSAIASQGKDESSLGVLFDNVFVEVLDLNGNPVNRGEEGEVVVTTLKNKYMPLIRYRIGDRAIKGDSFGGTLNLDSVLGRTLGVIYKGDGSYIDGQFFTSLFFNIKGIIQFQLIQKSIELLHLKVVKNEFLDQIEFAELIAKIKRELPSSDLEIFFLENIELSATGKIMYVYSDLS